MDTRAGDRVVEDGGVLRGRKAQHNGSEAEAVKL